MRYELFAPSWSDAEQLQVSLQDANIDGLTVETGITVILGTLFFPVESDNPERGCQQIEQNAVTGVVPPPSSLF